MEGEKIESSSPLGGYNSNKVVEKVKKPQVIESNQKGKGYEKNSDGRIFYFVPGADTDGIGCPARAANATRTTSHGKSATATEAAKISGTAAAAA